MRINGRKKKLETKYIVLIIILSICVLIGILSLTVRDDRDLSAIEKGLKDVGVNIQKFIYMPFRYVGDKLNNYNDMKRIYQKYKNIDEQASKVPLLEAENDELRDSLKELQNTLELNKLMTDYATVNATVINRNVGNWYNSLTIDKGEKQGLKMNMVVITNSGLIGKISKTTYYTSDVKLITTPDLNSKISVGIISSDTVTYGLLSGFDRNNKQLLVIDIIDNTTIKVRDKVTTSGLSDLYPKGILVGTVSKVENDEFGISKTIKVTPAANFNNLRYVTVLKGPDTHD
jgi:rod shape-determining protein MreC